MPYKFSMVFLIFLTVDTQCKPNFSEIINGQTGSSTEGQKPTFDAESIVGLLIWFCCVLYSSIRTASNGQTERLIGSDKVLAKNDEGSSGRSNLSGFRAKSAK